VGYVIDGSRLHESWEGTSEKFKKERRSIVPLLVAPLDCGGKIEAEAMTS
jgi:hypothetical protein